MLHLHCDMELLLDCVIASQFTLHYCEDASQLQIHLFYVYILDRNSLLGDKVGHVGGTAFTNVVPRQQNICLTIARGIEGPTALVADCLKKAACRLEHVLRIPFEMSTRILRGFHFVN